MSLIADLRDSRELLANLTLREIRGKYKRTALGQLWSLVNPLAAMLIYTVVFGFLLRIQPEPGDPSGLDVFALWLLCGLLPWSFMSSVINGGMGSLVGNDNLIKKVYFPRFTLVAASTLSWMFSWSIEMAALAVVLLVLGAFVVPWLPLVVVFMALLGVFALGIALALSVANVYFRDTQHFVAILLQMWFYLTPILYPLSYVEEQAARLAERGVDLPLVTLYRLNPMERFIEVFRDLLYDNRFPTLADSLWCVGWAAGAFALGYAFFARREPRIAEEL